MDRCRCTDVLPKRGFTNRNSKDIEAVNVSALERFDNDTEVTIATLIEAGVIKDAKDGVKILRKRRTDQRSLLLK